MQEASGIVNVDALTCLRDEENRKETTVRPGQIVARIEDAGTMPERLPNECWTDATCEFVVSEN